MIWHLVDIFALEWIVIGEWGIFWDKMFLKIESIFILFVE